VNNIYPSFGAAPGTQLGPLEQQVLQVLWARRSATVRELLEEEKITQAYTTVMTTLDRLYKKGMLSRLAEGRAYRYSPSLAPEEFRRVSAMESIRQLVGTGGESSLPLSYLVDALSVQDARLLDELQVLVEKKRDELGKKEKE
jgi:predicted transcriptional regulator